MPTRMLTYDSGLFAAMAAYGMWGFLPLYFQFLGETSPR
jgi:EamA domain-containing membrane protein RarD